MECSIINPALSLLMKHLVIGQRQKATNFSAFHWSPRGSLVSNRSAFRNPEGSTFTEKDRTKLNYRIGPKRPSMFAVEAKIYGVSIINPALSLLMKHLVIGQHQKVSNFSGFHWSPYGSLYSIVSIS